MAKVKKQVRKTRPIFIEHLEKIDRVVFNEFHKQIADMIKDQRGLYALYRNDTLYYIGLASNLRNRIKNHLKDKHKNSWTHFSFYILRKVDHIRELEALLLRIAFPQGNSQKGKLKGSKNLYRSLDKKIKKHQEEKRKKILGRKRKITSTITKTKRKQKRVASKTYRPLKGLMGGGKMIYRKYKGKDYKAWISGNGKIKYNGKWYDSPSVVGRVVRGGKATNGWRFWRYKNKSGELVDLSELRK